jgi:hypothetical protein
MSKSTETAVARELATRCLKATFLLEIVLIVPQLLLVGLVALAVAQFNVLWAILVVVAGLLGIPLDLGLIEKIAVRAAEKRGWGPNLFFKIDVDREKEIVGPIRWHLLYGKVGADRRKQSETAHGR